MMSLGLAATAGILGALLLMGGDIERKSDNVENIWARASAPAPCTPAELLEGTVAYPAAPDAETSCAAERPQPRSTVEHQAIAGPGAAIPAAVRTPPRRPTQTPTYIRKPQAAPEPKPEHFALEALRGGI